MDGPLVLSDTPRPFEDFRSKRVSLGVDLEKLRGTVLRDIGYRVVGGGGHLSIRTSGDDRRNDLAETPCPYRKAHCRRDRVVQEDRNQQCCESELCTRAYGQLQIAERHSRLVADRPGHILANAREHPIGSQPPSISRGLAQSSGSSGGVRSQSISDL